MTRLLCILLLLFSTCTPRPVPAQTYPNGAVHDFHPEISYDHFRFEPFYCNPLIICAGAEEGTVPKFNMGWHRMSIQVLIITRDYWIPYPNRWELEDDLIAWVIADYALMFDGVPLWFRYDFNCDGYCNLSDLTFMGLAMSRGDEDLTGFTFMGEIYNTRRAR